MVGICVISARGGSQGVPGKNIRPILGKPLIAWSIEQALATPEIDRVVVSTDSPQIAEAARAAGAETPFLRPEHLSNSEAGKFQVWQHAIQACEEKYNEKYEFFVDLDCTNPLRDVADISAAIKQFRDAQVRQIEAIFSVCEARKNPYFNVLEKNADGSLKICKKGEGHVDDLIFMEPEPREMDERCQWCHVDDLISTEAEPREIDERCQWCHVNDLISIEVACGY